MRQSASLGSRRQPHNFPLRRPEAGVRSTPLAEGSCVRLPQRPPLPTRRRRQPEADQDHEGWRQVTSEAVHVGRKFWVVGWRWRGVAGRSHRDEPSDSRATCQRSGHRQSAFRVRDGACAADHRQRTARLQDGGFVRRGMLRLVATPEREHRDGRHSASQNGQHLRQHRCEKTK